MHTMYYRSANDATILHLMDGLKAAKVKAEAERERHEAEEAEKRRNAALEHEKAARANAIGAKQAISTDIHMYAATVDATNLPFLCNCANDVLMCSDAQ